MKISSKQLINDIEKSLVKAILKSNDGKGVYQDENNDKYRLINGELKKTN